MNLNLNKKTISAALVYLIALFLFVFVFLIIPFPKTVSSWIEFAFTVISIIASMGISAYAFAGKEELTSKVYGYPVFRVGLYYVAAQLIVCVLVSLLGCFLYIPEWICLLISVVLICFAAIGVIATDTTRDVIQTMEAETNIATKQMKYFRADAATISYNVENLAVKKELEKLAEMFKYSDPVSNEKTEPYENELYAKLEELRASLNVDTEEEIINSIKEIKNLLAERNRICKLSK